MIDQNLLPSGFPLTEEDLAHTPGAVIRLVAFLLDENRMLRQENGLFQKRVERLEEIIGKNSSNSSRPPSSDSPFTRLRKQEGEKKRPGGKPGHPGHSQQLLAPTQEVEVRPSVCTCGNTFFPETLPYHTHQIIELPEKLVSVTHFLLHKGRCSRCGKMNKASIPEEHSTGFGPRFTAMAAEFAGNQGDSRRLLKDFCFSVLGVPVSLGGIQKMIKRASAAIAPHHETIASVAQNSSVAHADETTWRRNGALNWLWLLSGGNAAFFRVHEKRSRKAFDELKGNFSGILVSDDYAVYTDWPNLRQTCLAHLIREARALSEKKDEVIAKFGKTAKAELKRLCAMSHSPPTIGQWNAFWARFIKMLAPVINRKDEAGRFASRLLLRKDSLWVFLEKEGVSPTNNHAERCLRFPVLWRKRSFGTQSESGNRWVERILSLRQTCRIRKIRTFPLLVDAVRAFFQGIPPDISWIADPATIPQTL